MDFWKKDILPLWVRWLSIHFTLSGQRNITDHSKYRKYRPVLPKDLGSIPSTHTAAHNCVTPVPGDLTPPYRHTWRCRTREHIKKDLKTGSKVTPTVEHQGLFVYRVSVAGDISLSGQPACWSFCTVSTLLVWRYRHHHFLPAHLHDEPKAWFKWLLKKLIESKC